MTDRSIFGEMQAASPNLLGSAGPRTQTHTPCHGLFGARLFPGEDVKATEPGIGPERLARSFS